MSLIKRSDWPSLIRDSWLSDFFDNDRFFDSDFLMKSVPAANVKEGDRDFEVEIAAPGMTKKDFNITVDKGVLTISSEKKEEKEEKDKDFTRREFNYSAFSRSFALPENVNEEDIKASYDNGILKLLITKKTAAITHKKAIEIK